MRCVTGKASPRGGFLDRERLRGDHCRVQARLGSVGSTLQIVFLRVFGPLDPVFEGGKGTVDGDC